MRSWAISRTGIHSSTATAAPLWPCIPCSRNARAFSIDWSVTRKDAYLDALTKEIENPSKGHLDAYLKPFMRDPIAYEHLATALVQAPGLDGSVQDAELNEVLGNTDEPFVKAQYEAMLTKRKRS
ncbi:MAG: Filamentation induced by cAMP protein Fic [Bradyrhizobium sp.]|nr:Filamentation induced by cAMP protein Fic [Bradyrhizobium sp.]